MPGGNRQQTSVCVEKIKRCRLIKEMITQKGSYTGDVDDKVCCGEEAEGDFWRRRNLIY